jgi:hypothetical protein
MDSGMAFSPSEKAVVSASGDARGVRRRPCAGSNVERKRRGLSGKPFNQTVHIAHTTVQGTPPMLSF